MAESKKTRIILRNDSTGAWAAVADSAILLKGEIGIEFDPKADSAHKVRMKIGDGKSAWGALEYFGESADQRFAKTYQVDIEAGADKVAAITTAVGSDELKAGDIAVVREAIHGDDKKQYTAFVYNGTAWAAMDGNYNAENVYFANDFTYTAAIGVLDKPASGNATLAAAGKNIKEVLASILAKQQNPSVTQPSASITLNQATAYEVGAKVTPTYTAKLNAGSYTYGPATGIVASTYSVTDGVEGHDAQTGATGSFPEMQVVDGTNYKLTATISYEQGAIPKDNLGSEVPALRIAAGSKSATSGAITGYRSIFAGASVTPIAIDSTNIRALTGKKGAYTASFNLAIPDGCTQVVIALPNGHTVKTVEDTGAFGTDIFSVFTSQKAQVEGLNGYTAAEYNVYVYTPASALGSNTYKITCA